MIRMLSRSARLRRSVLMMACLPATAAAVNVRVVTFNLQDDVSTPTPTNALPNLATVIEGIGQQKYVGDSILQLPDVIAVQETTSNSVTVSPLVNQLNTYYNNSGTYNYSSYQATTSDGVTSGGGPNALIYNQTTMNLIASVGVGTPQSGTNGEFRQVVRYELQPIADKGTSGGIFYVYDSHYKSGSAGTSDDGSTDGALRNGEAMIIRNDEAANLPSNAAVLYVGDYNGDGTTEAAYQTIIAANSPSGVMQGQGIDPLYPTGKVSITFGSTTLGILTETDTKLQYRDDLQVMTSNVYNDAPNTLDYIANSYHAFGNNGTVAYQGSVNTGSNTAINDIIGNGSLTVSQVLAAENKTLGSDHLPVVADYSITILANGIWLGGVGNWSNAAMWSNGVVPNSSTVEVKIDNGNAIASVVSLDQVATAQDLTLDANDTLLINVGESLTLAGPNPSTFNGTFNNSGSLIAASVTNTGSFTTTSALTVSGTFNSSGTILVSGTSVAAGDVYNSGHAQIGGTFTESGNFNNSGTASIGGTFNAQGNFNNSGSAVVSGAFTYSGTFNNSGSVTIGGTFTALGNFINSGTAIIGGTQNWSSGTVFTNLAGTATFNTDAGSANVSSLCLNVSAGTVTLAATQHLAALNISSGAVVSVIRSNARSVVVVPLLTIAGTLDLTGNDLDVSGSNLTAVNSLVAQGFNAGGPAPWTGTGMTSSMAANDSTQLTALGVIQNNQSGAALFTGSNLLDNTTPGAGDIIVRYTFYGDANLDGTVDGSDYSLIDNGYLNGATGWYNGDFNYDNVIDGSDYTLIDNAYNSQGTQLTAELGGPDAVVTDQTSAVPEPASLAAIGLAVGLLLGRQRTIQRDSLSNKTIDQ